MSSGPFTSAASAELRPAAPFGAEVFNLANRRRNRQPTVTLDERLDRAGLAIASHLFSAYDGTDTTGDDALGAHAGTMVAILATLAAEAALQAAEVAAREPLATTRDGWVYGGPADGLLFRYGNEFAGPNAVTRSVWDLVADAARGAGAAVPSASDLERIVARAEAHLGTKPCPILTAPADFRPRALLRPAAARHRHDTATIAAAEGLCASAEIALAHGAALAQVVRHEPDAGVLTLIAAETLIGAARLTPLPFAFN